MMKRILSSVLAVATVAAVMLFPTSAEVTSVTQEVEVKYLSTVPTFDGDITAEEWGEKSFTVSGATAAKPGDTAPSEYNTFAWYTHEYDTTLKTIISEDEEDKAKIQGLTYDVWLRWDTKYLYMAVLVNDPDGYYLPNGRENIWNGDCVQFRVDPMGPNSYLTYKNPEYDYAAEGFDTEKSVGVGYMPWAYRTKICNIGMGYPADRNEAQVFDRADQGTGNMEKPQKLNDPKKLGPGKNPFGTDVDYASLFGMKVNDNGTNTYEVAVPWAFLDQWGKGQAAVGYAWGMSIVVLNGYNDGDATTSPFESYLTWGSGICGAQQDDSWLRPTLGGSNAIILSDVDALSGEKVEGLPVAVDKNPVDGEVVHNIIDVTGPEAYYFTTTDEVAATDGSYEVSMDIVYLGEDYVNPGRTYVGTWLGEGYGMAAGWDAVNKEFFIAPQLFDNGPQIDGSIPYASSDEFDWQIGDWHNITIKVAGETVQIYCDDELVLEDTDKRNALSGGDNGKYQIIVYNIGDFAYDNMDVTVAQGTHNFTFDSDDAEFNKSDMNLNAIPMANKIIPGACKNVDENSLYNCLIRPGVNAEGKNVLKCDFCGHEEESTVYGDANGDGKVNLDDVTEMLKYIAKWEGVAVDAVAADVNVDGSIALADVTLMLQYIAKWDVVLGA